MIKLANLYRKIDAGTVEDYRKFMVAENADEYFKMAPVYTYDPRSTQRDFLAMSQAISAKDGSKLASNQQSKFQLAMKWAEGKDIAGYGAYYQVAADGSFAIGKKIQDEKRQMITELRGPVTPNYAKVKSTLDKLELEAFTKIIMGASVDAEFTKFVESWKALGGDDATKEVNETYKK